MHRYNLRILTMIAAVAFAACGDSTDVVNQLSDAEARELAGAVMLATVDGTPDAAVPATAGPAATPVSYSEEVDVTGNCQEGGTLGVHAAVTITGDTESDAGTISYSMTQTHHACVATSPNGIVFTLDGAPSVDVDLSAATDGAGSVTYSGTMQGAVDWATDGRHGTCSIAIEFSGSLDTTAEQPVGQFSLAGNVCRVSVQESAQLG